MSSIEELERMIVWDMMWYGRVNMRVQYDVFRDNFPESTPFIGIESRIRDSMVDYFFSNNPESILNSFPPTVSIRVEMFKNKDEVHPSGGFYFVINNEVKRKILEYINSNPDTYSHHSGLPNKEGEGTTRIQHNIIWLDTERTIEYYENILKIQDL